MAAARARGPGSFAVEIIDALHALDRAALVGRRRVSVMGQAVLDLRVYAIVDPEVSGGHDLADLSRQLAAGGATLVQLRDKLSDTRVMVERARAVKAALGSVPLLINDRVDVALAAGADGVHIGWDDMAPRMRAACSVRDAIIGLTIKTVARRRAPLELIDYAGIGGVYGTTSKTTKNAPIGPAGLAQSSRRCTGASRLSPAASLASRR